jgi:cytochrome c
MKHVQTTSNRLPMLAWLMLACVVLPTHASKELAQSKNCMSCHSAEKKLIGPSIKAIADKYPAADASKIAALAKKVREGGVGVWGAIPMVSNPQVSVTESEALVKWFLGAN